MKVIETEIPDVKIIEPTVFGDERGFFMETWQQKKFEKLVTGKTTRFVQDNHSKSKQGKLVRVIAGEVFDVAVDIRKGSPTFGKWIGVYLSAENKHQLWVPEGFAHGFYVTSDEAGFAYKCTDYYNPKSEVSIIWNDYSLNINWPMENELILSEKDKCGI